MNFLNDAFALDIEYLFVVMERLIEKSFVL